MLAGGNFMELMDIPITELCEIADDVAEAMKR